MNYPSFASLKKRMAKSPTLLLASSAFMGQLILFAGMPLLSRVYGPEAFGTFAMVSAISAFASVVPSLRLELAIPIEEKEELAERIVLTSLRFSIYIGSVTALVLIAISALGGLRNYGDGFHVAMWCAPGVAATTAMLLVMNQWAIRRGDYRPIAVRNVTRNTSMILMQVAFGFVASSAASLMLGLLLANLISIASMVRAGGLTMAGIFFKKIRSVEVLCQWKRFSAKLIGSGLLNNAGAQLPIVFFAFYFSQAETGQLGMAQRVLAVPVAVLGVAIGQSFIGEFARLTREGKDGKPVFVSSSIRLAIVSAIFATMAIAFSPIVFSAVLGREWGIAGSYSSILAVGVAAQLVAAPLSQVIIVKGHTRIQLWWDATRTAVTLGAIAGLGYWGAGEKATIWAMALISALSYLVLWVIAYLLLKHSPPNIAIADRGIRGAS